LSDQIYIYPTDTVWGIGANIYSREAQDKIRSIKKSPKDKSMSVLFQGQDMLERYINYPALWNELFNLEITFLIPKNWCKKDIPDWVATGPYLGIRCLENEELTLIRDKEKAPITSTSLNLTGGGPITNIKEVKAFKDENTSLAEVVNLNDQQMSGTSSSILLVKEENKYEIIRAGKNIRKIESVLGLSTT